MSEPSKAVFLSYASQDAEAAKRICDALRAAGLEVWFDQSELRGGDAWDQKIRRQIKDCALFVPVISANTNARAEGYFRLEWKLAVDRSHLMADDAPFLFPVAIDDTPDATARVPDKFREVQWTRLNVKDTPETLARRIAQLLAGEHGAEARGRSADDRVRAGDRRRPTWLRYVWATVGVVIALVYGLRPLWSPARRAESKPVVAGTSSPVAAAAVSAARQLVARARAMSLDKYDSTADDYATAEGLLKQALALDQNDAEVWAFSSVFNTSMRTRGFDFTPVRREMARRDAERALKLAPDSLEALYALGRAQRDFEPDAAEQTFKKMLARNPDEFRALGNLASIYDYTGRPDEAALLYERVATADPAHEALTRYTEYLLFFHYGRFAEAERCIRRSVAIQPSANSQSGLAMLLLTWKGETDEAARVLATGPTAARNEPRTIWTTAFVQLCRRSPDDTLKTLDRLADDFIQDNWFVGPKAYFAGRAHALAGRTEAARIAWESALAITNARLKDTPGDLALHVMRGQLLAFLGQPDEALREARAVAELGRGNPRDDRYWFISPALIYATLGRADDAMPLLEKLCRPPPNQIVGWPLTSALLRLDPLWDRIRDDPRFQALCAEPAAAKSEAEAAPLTEGAQLAARALSLITKVGFTRDDLAPAEDFARRATEKEPDNAAAWGVRAGVQAAWLFRGWDMGEKRLQDTQTFANHALALDPKEPEALLALGHVLRTQGAYDQAVQHLRRAVAANPTHVRLARALGYTLTMDGRDEEARKVLLAAAQHAPRDPLLRYELALAYTTYGAGGRKPENLAGALEQLDAAIAIQPFSSALILKAAVLGGWRGDLPAMRAVLDQQDKLPLAERAEDRSVSVELWAGLLEHRPDRVEAAAALTARTYFDDLVMPLRPKAWSLALAHRLAGKEHLARNDWQAAEAVLRERLKDKPDDQRYTVELAITLAWLGRREEAAHFVAPIEPVWKEDFQYWRPSLLARYYAALGDAAKAAPYLAQDIDRNVFTTRKVVPLDPWWDKLRGQPEFEALLKEPASRQ
jgi:tetratricopeptide (TPR) repeat protein